MQTPSNTWMRSRSPSTTFDARRATCRRAGTRGRVGWRRAFRPAPVRSAARRFIIHLSISARRASAAVSGRPGSAPTNRAGAAGSGARPRSAAKLGCVRDRPTPAPPARRRPCHSCGRVYCGYSSSPPAKLSSASASAHPTTPGNSRTQASISAIAAGSPPDSTKSPRLISSTARASSTRSSTPSKRPQIRRTPGSRRARAPACCSSRRPRGDSMISGPTPPAPAIAASSTSGRITMPGPPPNGASSTERCLSVANLGCRPCRAATTRPSALAGQRIGERAREHFREDRQYRRAPSHAASLTKAASFPKLLSRR